MVRLREILLQEDFDLNDKFCDDVELEEAWNKLQLPDTFVSFFLIYLISMKRI